MHTRLSGWVVMALCISAASEARSADSAASIMQAFTCRDTLGVSASDWSDDSRFLVGAGINIVCMLDTATYEIKRKSNLMFVAWQPHTHRFLAVRNWFNSGAKPYLQLMDATTGKVLAKRPLLRRNKPEHVAFSDDGAYLLWVDPNRGARLLDATTLQDLSLVGLSQDTCHFYTPDWAPQSHRLVGTEMCGDPDSFYVRLRVIDADTGTELYREDGPLNKTSDGLPHFVDWSPNGALFSWGSGANRLTITNAQGRHIMDVDDASTFGINWSPSGNYFIMPRYPSKFAIFETLERREIFEVDYDEFGEIVGWLDDETIMVHTGADGKVSAVDVIEGTRTLLLTLTNQWSQVSVSPDKQYVIANGGWGDDYGMHVIRIADGSVVLHDPEASPISVYWSPDNATLSYERQGGFAVAPLP